MANYEETMKRLMEHARTAHDASVAASGLDDKVKFQRTHRDITEALRLLRLHYYDFEDATKVPVTKCDECGSIIPRLVPSLPARSGEHSPTEERNHAARTDRR